MTSEINNAKCAQHMLNCMEDIDFPKVRKQYFTKYELPKVSSICPKCGQKRVADGVCWVIGCGYQEL